MTIGILPKPLVITVIAKALLRNFVTYNGLQKKWSRMSETTVSSNGRSSQTTESVASKAVFVRTIIPFLLLQFSVGLCASLQVEGVIIGLKSYIN